MTELLGYGLTENPFSLLPNTRVTKWAGRKEVRTLLLDVAKSVLSTDTGVSEFVFLHGSFGAGKSHALRFLETKINVVNADNFKSLAVYVPKVKLGEKISFLELYFQIIQIIGVEFIKNLSLQIKERLKAAEVEEAGKLDREEERRIRDENPDYFQEIVLNRLDKEDRQIIQLLLYYADGNDSVGKYFIEKGKPSITGSDFQKIDSDYMASRILASLFRAMTVKIGGQEPVYNGAYLFLDEVEDILEAKAGEQVSFFTALREVVNRLPYNFALIIAFSADAALLEAVIPLSIQERLSRNNIELPALGAEEAKEFIKSHLLLYRPEDFDTSRSYHPFTEEAIDFILESVVILIPRRIFRELRIVLERAIKRESLEPGEEINAEMAESIMLGFNG